MSTSVTGSSKKDIILNKVLYIYYLMCFWKNSKNVYVLIDFDS